MAASSQKGVRIPQEPLSIGKDTWSRSEKTTQNLDSSRLQFTQTAAMTLSSTTATRSLSRSGSEATYGNSLAEGSKVLDRTGEQTMSTENLSQSRSTSSKRSSTTGPVRIWNALPAWTLEYQALTPIQQRVMQYVAETSEIESAAAKARLERSWRVFNISDEDFSAIEVYLARKVPLTIRVDLRELFPYLIRDPFYR